MQKSTIKPGFLVSLKTSLTGNVSYTKWDKESTPEEKRWETLRRISDVAEFERAKETRSRAVYMIRRVCSVSNFGLLCPEGDSVKLESAVESAQELIREFNATATCTRLNLYVIAGKVAEDDAQAIRAINSEVKDLLAAMATGVKELNVEAIRKAANKAKQVSEMLSPEANAKLATAIRSARRAARQLSKSGEVAARRVDKATLDLLKQSRTMFLDIGESAEVESPIAEVRVVDFDPDRAAESMEEVRSLSARTIDFEEESTIDIDFEEESK